MRRLGRAASGLWLLVLAATGVVVVLGSPEGARAATPASSCIPPLCPTTTTSSTSSSSSTTSPTSSTTTVSSSTSTSTTTSTTPAPSPYAAAFLPCGTTTGSCDESPARIQLGYPSGTPAAAVQVNWVATGRPAAAPDPAAASVTLPWTDGTDCGSNQRCWPWPAPLTDSSFILNGTYQISACGSLSKGGGCGAASPPQTIGLGVPPGPPTDVQARSAAGQVGLSWQAPAARPPDLVGYAVARNGRTVYACSTGGLGPGASVRCPSSLTVTDQPGNGSYSYTVSTLRLAADQTARSVLYSPATAANAGGRVTVPGPVPGSAGAGGAGIPGFTLSPVIGSVGVIDGPGGAGAGLRQDSSPGQGLAGIAPGAGDAADPRSLDYGSDSPVVGKAASPLALHVKPVVARPDVGTAGMLALGLLVLAVGAHFLYLRAEIGAIQVRIAERRRREA